MLEPCSRKIGISAATVAAVFLGSDFDPVMNQARPASDRIAAHPIHTSQWRLESALRATREGVGKDCGAGSFGFVTDGAAAISLKLNEHVESPTGTSEGSSGIVGNFIARVDIWRLPVITSKSSRASVALVGRSEGFLAIKPIIQSAKEGGRSLRNSESCLTVCSRCAFAMSSVDLAVNGGEPSQSKIK